MSNKDIVVWVSVRLLFGILVGTTLAYRYYANEYKQRFNYCNEIIKYNNDIKQPMGNIELI